MPRLPAEYNVLCTALSELLSAQHALTATHCNSLRSLESATGYCTVMLLAMPTSYTVHVSLHDSLHSSFVCAWLDSQQADLNSWVSHKHSAWLDLQQADLNSWCSHYYRRANVMCRQSHFSSACSGGLHEWADQCRW